MHGARDGRVEAAAREGRVIVDGRLRVGHDHAVELESLGEREVDQDDALGGHGVVSADVRDLALELLGKPHGAAAVRHDHGREALLAAGLGDQGPDGVEVRIHALLAVGDLRDGRLDARAVHRADGDALLLGQQAREELGDLGARAVARRQAALLDRAVRRREDLAHLVEARAALVDRLVGVAQQQEVGPREVAREHGELRGRVVLHLVDHDEARVVGAVAADEELEVEPLGGAQARSSAHALADAVEAQPREVLDVLVRVGEAALEELLRVPGGVVVAVGGDHLAEELHLLLHVERERLLHGLLAVGHLCDAAAQPVVQLVLDERDETGSDVELRELLDGALDLRDLEQHGLAAAHLAEVALRKGESVHGRIERAKRVEPRVGARAAVVESQACEEVLPGERVGVGFAEGGQHVVDVGLEHRVGREQPHLVGAERLAVAVEEERDALQEHRGLARPRDAADEKSRHVLVADYLVLLALDRGRDRLQLLRVVARQRREQKRVLDRDGRVEVGAQPVAHDVVLAPQLELDVAHAPVDHVGGRAHLLVVVGLGDGVAPVHDQGHPVLVGDARRADVDVARRPAGAHPQADLGEVRLAQQHDRAAELLDREVVLLVVGVDDRVERLDRGERLHRLVGPAKVDADLVGEVAQVLRRILVAHLDLLGQVRVDLLELRVDRAQVLLLLDEGGVGALVCALLVCHVRSMLSRAGGADARLHRFNPSDNVAQGAEKS